MAKRKTTVVNADEALTAIEEAIELPDTDRVFIGRMVHYVMVSGAHRPAVVVEYHGDGLCNLQVFNDGGNDGYPGHQGTIWLEGIGHDENGSLHTWHFIESEG